MVASPYLHLSSISTGKVAKQAANIALNKYKKLKEHVYSICNRDFGAMLCRRNSYHWHLYVVNRRNDIRKEKYNSSKKLALRFRGTLEEDILINNFMFSTFTFNVSEIKSSPHPVKTMKIFVEEMLELRLI